MLNIKKTLTNILAVLTPPTTVNLKVNEGYYQAIRTSGTGLAMYISLPKTPTNITSNDLQLYNGSSWVTATPAGFGMRGMTCVIRLTFTGTLNAGVYGLQGTLNITY